MSETKRMRRYKLTYKRAPYAVTFLQFFIILIMASSAWAGSLVPFVGGSFYAGGTISVSGTIAPQAAYDLNLRVMDENRNALAHDVSIASDANGFFSQSWSDFNAGDHNVLVDTNSDLNTNLYFTVHPFADIDINYVNMSPPFQKDANVIFNLQPKDENGNALTHYADLNVQLVNSTGTVLDTNTAISKHATASHTIDANFIASQTGTLFFSVNGGSKTFPINVYSFRVFATSYDTDGDPEEFFAAGDTVTIKARVTSFDNNIIYSGNAASVDGNVLKPDGNLTALSFSSNRGLYQATFSPTQTGVHTVSLLSTVGSDTLVSTFTFTVATYQMSMEAKKNDKAGSKERFPAVFAPDQNGLFQLTFTRLSNKKKLSGSSELNGLCSKSLYTIDRTLAGSTTKTRVADANIFMTQTTKGCDLNITSPHAPGNYNYAITGRDLNIANTLYDLTASASAVVQNFVVFFDPVDPNTYASDPNRASKFVFFKDENVGFRPSVIGLASGLSGKVKNVSGITLITASGETALGSSYYDFNVDNNLLTMYSTALSDNNVADGIVPIQVSVDINSFGAGKDQNSVTAFGSIRFKTMDVFVEAATNAAGSTKNEEFGPAIFEANDDNVFLKVTVKDASGTAVKFASVKIKSIRNIEFWETIDANNNTPVQTNASGVAVLDVGVFPSGGFLVEVQATKDGKTGTGEAFLLAKKYIVFGEAVEVKSIGGATVCQFQNNFGTADDVNLLLVTMDPFDFNIITDANVDVNTGIKLFKEGGLKEFEEPTQVDFNVTLGTANCQFFGPVVQDYNILKFSAPASGWETGFYQSSIVATSATKGQETGIGFFQITPFNFGLTPVGQSEGGPGDGPEEAESVEPGQWFDFNVVSAHDVNLEAFLEDDSTFQQLDDTIPLRSGSTDLNTSTADHVAASTATTVRAMIPPTLKPGEYLLLVEGTDENGNVAESELFLEVSNYNYIVARSDFWNQNETELTYKQASSGQLDTNIMDDLLGSAKYAATADINHKGTAIVYDRWIDNNIDGMADRLNDWNTLILVDTTNNLLYVDIDRDGNFMDDNGVLPFIVRLGEYVNDVNLVSQNTSSVYIDDGNHPILTGITLSSFDSLKYIRYPQEFALSDTSDEFIGSFSLNRAVYLPLLVKRPSGTALASAVVTITKVFRIGAGFGPPEVLDTSKWSATTASSDANGLALPTITILQTGTFLVEITITSGSETQYFFPWDGPIFQVSKYQNETYLTKPTSITIDFNNVIDSSFDLSYLPVGSVYDDNYGYFSEADQNYDLDNDGQFDENWYFIRAKPTGALSDYNILGDDDKNFDVPGGLTDDGGAVTELGESEEIFFTAQPWGGCMANYTASMNDCNTYQGRYWLSPSDANAIDNNAVLDPALVFEPDANSNYKLFWTKDQPNYADRNVHGMVELSETSGKRASVSGTVAATLYSTVGNLFTPLGSFTGTIANGIAKVALGDLNIGSYELEYALTFTDGNTEQVFNQFTVR